MLLVAAHLSARPLLAGGSREEVAPPERRLVSQSTVISSILLADGCLQEHVRGSVERSHGGGRERGAGHRVAQSSAPLQDLLVGLEGLQGTEAGMDRPEEPPKKTRVKRIIAQLEGSAASPPAANGAIKASLLARLRALLTESSRSCS